MDNNTLIILLAVVLVGFGLARRIRSGSRIPSQAELRRLISEGARLVDVRSPEEFSAGHHPRALNIPLEQVTARADEFRGDAVVILYCASGNRSGQAIAALSRHGLTGLVNGGGFHNLPAD